MLTCFLFEARRACPVLDTGAGVRGTTQNETQSISTTVSQSPRPPSQCPALPARAACIGSLISAFTTRAFQSRLSPSFTSAMSALVATLSVNASRIVSVMASACCASKPAAVSALAACKVSNVALAIGNPAYQLATQNAKLPTSHPLPRGDGDLLLRPRSGTRYQGVQDSPPGSAGFQPAKKKQQARCLRSQEKKNQAGKMPALPGKKQRPRWPRSQAGRKQPLGAGGSKDLAQRDDAPLTRRPRSCHGL